MPAAPAIPGAPGDRETRAERSRAACATLPGMARRPPRSRRVPTLLAAATWALLLFAAIVPAVGAAGPPFGDRPGSDGSHLVDDAGVLTRQTEAALDQGLAALEAATGTDIVVYLQVKPAARGPEAVISDASALLEAWTVGGPDGDGGVLMVDFDRRVQRAIARFVAGPALSERVSQADLDRVVAEAVDGPLGDGAWLSAVTQGVVALSTAVGGAGAEPPLDPGATDRPEPQGTGAPGEPDGSPGPTPRPLLDTGTVPPPGPPFPDPIEDVTVYDYARVLAPDVEASLSETIEAIETRTGAEVAVYTQVKPSSDTFAEAERDAIDLMDQWGVGRRGFDDGLVILVDLDESRCHGQAILYAGRGYRESYLTNADRQAIFDRDMLPHLRACDFDTALVAAMARIDENATPERARTLQLARQIDVVTGLVVAPLVIFGVLGWAGWNWLRFGRDPDPIDDPSILMPAPPPGLTPAAAAVILDGRARRHALTTALVDLAGRGELRFRESAADASGRVEIEVLTPDERNPRIARNRQSPLGKAEAWALERLRHHADSRGHLDAERLLRFAGDVDGFEERLERHVADAGWYREPPERSTDRWSFRAAVVLCLGIAGTVVAWNLPSDGLLLLGAGAIAAGILMFFLARAMPQRTMQGAMVNAWLAAYRRTLQRTLERAPTMDHVVASGAVPWLESADQAVVWGYALGLHEEVEDVLERSVEAARSAPAGTSFYLPTWYVAGAGAAGGGGSAMSHIPDLRGMAAVLATVGSSTSGSSSGGGSGGFGGGGSGGGGGGAGGGF
jgi:uncharacterized membrane protein YgcG